MKDTKLFIVVPCYNEQEALPRTSKVLDEFVTRMINEGLIGAESRILFVDDGSRDKTWQIISDLHAANPRFEGLALAHNAGHQNALWAGMDTVKDECDALISIDADLQDDVNAMEGFLKEFDAGADIVYGVRSSRASDTFFKRFTAEGFYKVMALMGVETVFNHADFRLMSQRAVKALMDFPETNLYLRGLTPALGFKTAKVEYERSARLEGESKYPLKKMLALAFQGITSFSVKPLHLISVIGFICALMGLVFWICGLGFTVFSSWFTCGLILLALGLTAEYIGKVYTEVKRRPRYIARERLK